MSTTTYTVLRADGEINARGLSAPDAAVEVMTYDGHDYDILRDQDGWRLFTTKHSRNSPLGGRPMTGTVIWSFATHEAEARAEILAEVIKNAGWWRGQSVITDADYDQMVADLAAEETGDAA